VPRSPLIAPAAAVATLLVPLSVLDLRMRATGGTGIIAFELAGPGRSEEILRAWGTEGRRAARASLLLDFPWLVAYTMLGVQLTERARDALTERGATALGAVAPAVKVAQVAAGACDAVENAALLGVVARGGDARLASIARSAARAKFAGLTAGWLYHAVAVVGRRRRV
jgi:hypothetical protein